jgi:ankyrin repeat protein
MVRRNAGFTPLHLACQEGHLDMASLLLNHGAGPNSASKNGLTPLHLCAQEDKVNCAAILVKLSAQIDPQAKAGYTPLHVACHFSQINMVKFLLIHSADVNILTKVSLKYFVANNMKHYNFHNSPRCHFESKFTAATLALYEKE